MCSYVLAGRPGHRDLAGPVAAHVGVGVGQRGHLGCFGSGCACGELRMQQPAVAGEPATTPGDGHRDVVGGSVGETHERVGAAEGRRGAGRMHRYAIDRARDREPRQYSVGDEVECIDDLEAGACRRAAPALQRTTTPRPRPAAGHRRSRRGAQAAPGRASGAWPSRWPFDFQGVPQQRSAIVARGADPDARPSTEPRNAAPAPPPNIVPTQAANHTASASSDLQVLAPADRRGRAPAPYSGTRS